MTIDIVGALERGFDRITTRPGGILVAAFATVAVLIGLVWETVLARFVAGDPFFAGVPQEMADQLSQDWSTYEVLLSVPVPVLGLFAGLVVLYLAREVLRIGAVRWFVGDASRPLSGSLFTRRLVWTLLNLVAGTVIYGLAVAGGLLLLVVPGIFLAVSLFFFNYEVVVEGENAIDALVNSYSLTAGHRIRLFLLGAVFVVLGEGVRTIGSPALLPGRIAPVVVGAVVTAAFGVFGLATAADAYRQLQAADEIEEPVEEELAAG